MQKISWPHPTHQVGSMTSTNTDLPRPMPAPKHQDDGTNVAMETFFAWQPQQPGSLPNCCYGTAVSPSMPGLSLGLLDRLPVHSFKNQMNNARR